MDKPTIVIIGASGGIGRYLMTSLCDYEIAGTYYLNNPYQSDWLNVYKDRTGGMAPFLYPVNIKRLEDLEHFAALVLGERIVLINATGYNHNAIGHKLGAAEWNEVMDINLMGSLFAAKAFLPHMREVEWGRIINLSSIVGQIGVKGTSAYSAAKAGLFGLTRTLAAENAHLGITVNALALGYFTVGMIEQVPVTMKEKLLLKIPMRRFGHPSNIDAAIRFLIEADYVTGATININGGLL